MDFLQQLGAEISPTSRSLTVDHFSLPLTDFESGVSKDQGLANGIKRDSGFTVERKGVVELWRTGLVL
jgi:hypothetical protein